MLVARHPHRWFPNNSIVTDCPIHVAQKASSMRGLSLCRVAAPVSGLGHTVSQYSSDTTKFHDGDWEMLRKSIAPIALKVVDMATEADIEDVILCDLLGVPSSLGPSPDTKVPPGNKGETRLKKLYRKVAPNKTYHSGERAKDLVSHLDMTRIRALAPVPLKEIYCAVENG